MSIQGSCPGAGGLPHLVLLKASHSVLLANIVLQRMVRGHYVRW
jgi:hypothetical protein